MPQRTIWTVGHSTHELPVLVGVLRGPGIEVVADVRSQPFSRRNPQFSQDRLRAALADAGLRYVFLGAELGGRLPEPEFHSADGHVLYGALARTKRFWSGLQRLLDGADGYRVAILCSEENPARCHRRLLIGRALVARNVEVVHIRGDGSVVPDQELGPFPPEATQDALFG